MNAYEILSNQADQMRRLHQEGSQTLHVLLPLKTVAQLKALRQSHGSFSEAVISAVDAASDPDKTAP